MKKIMIAMLAFSFLAGTTVFAQDASTQTAPKKEKKHKKSKKDKQAAEAPKAQ